MNYWQHLVVCILLGIIISLMNIFNVKFLNFIKFNLLYFWIGAIPHMLILTSDLDSSSSIVTKIWKILGLQWIWEPFVRAGHRETLHNWLWGPICLIGFWLIPILLMGFHISYSVLFGAVLMIWCHIIMDIIYSSNKKLFKFIHFW